MKKLISTILHTTYYILHTASPAFASLDEDTGIYTHAGEEVPTFAWILTLMGNILTAAITLIGLSAFIMLIVGAFSILTSGGNPEAMQKGQQTTTYAIIGLVVAVLAGFVFKILEGVFGVDLLTIKIPTL